MSGSWVSGEAPARRNGRAVLTGDGPQVSLDRAVGTNQEIWRGEPVSGSASSVPGLANWLLAAVAVPPAAVGDEQCCWCVPVADA